MSHRIIEDWMGQPCETLADLLRPGLRTVCVGINPAPTSVAVGHYYQGPLGQRFFARLASVGVLPPGDGFEDDRAFAAGIGFTDVVKRPTRRAADLLPMEFEFGKKLLAEKLADVRPEFLIFSFKKTAELLVGRFDGNGMIDRKFGQSQIIVMPGPYENAETAATTLRLLRREFTA